MTDSWKHIGWVQKKKRHQRETTKKGGEESQLCKRRLKLYVMKKERGKAGTHTGLEGGPEGGKKSSRKL